MLMEHATTFHAAPVIAALGDGHRVDALGFETSRLIVPGEATAGAYGIWEHVTQPGFGPPRHVHQREDEIFQVLEGKLLVWCAGETYEAVPGMFASLPRGVPHAFRAIGDTPARMVMTVVPGGFERFFAAVSHLLLPADMTRLEAICASYGVDIVGPPLA